VVLCFCLCVLFVCVCVCVCVGSCFCNLVFVCAFVLVCTKEKAKEFARSCVCLSLFLGFSLFPIPWLSFSFAQTLFLFLFLFLWLCVSPSFQRMQSLRSLSFCACVCICVHMRVWESLGASVGKWLTWHACPRDMNYSNGSPLHSRCSLVQPSCCGMRCSVSQFVLVCRSATFDVLPCETHLFKCVAVYRECRTTIISRSSKQKRRCCVYRRTHICLSHMCTMQSWCASALHSIHICVWGKSEATHSNTLQHTASHCTYVYTMQCWRAALR